VRGIEPPPEAWEASVGGSQTPRVPCSRDAKVSASATVSPSKGDSTNLSDDFAAALTMIATLPLTDAEKAEAVRRLLAER
jgi:hypothetical protein